MVKPDPEYTEDRVGFQQNMERLSFEESSFFSIYIQLVKLIFGEGPLRTPRKNRLVGNLPYRRIWEDIKVKSQGMEFYEQFFNFLRHDIA